MAHRSSANDKLIEELARQTATPVESVKKLYENEVKTLQADAKVDRFIGVIAGKRVKRKLRGTRRAVPRSRS